ncbi:MAG: hypothetical protein QXF12_00820 [Candidatus Aenigmatarchaeota archaeon]
MSTTGHHNREYTMEELMRSIVGLRETRILVTFGQSNGEIHKFNVHGRFFYRGYHLNGPDIYDYLRETEVPEDLIVHYSTIWDYLNHVMNFNYDFVSNNQVSFTIMNNPDMSVNSHKSIMSSEGYDKEAIFTTDISKRVFYDLVISADGEDIIKIKGIPHFGVPAVMKYLGKWLQIVEDKSAVVA